MNFPKEVLYYGTTVPPAKPLCLRAGPLSLQFEEGSLRYIRLGQREVLRRIYVAIRDHNWETAPGHLMNLQKDVASHHFQISFDMVNRLGEIDFQWWGSITGTARGTLEFRMEGVARGSFRRNRIGFCILHPILECAGRPCRVTKVDRSVESGEFPRYISPHQPFVEMRGISHEVAPGVTAEVSFTGDTFEMEDQRNWGDASYKIYSTPLALPYPVRVEAGARITQSVTLTLQGDLSAYQEEDAAPMTFQLRPATGKPIPALGLGASSYRRPLGPAAITRLKTLRPSHLRGELDLVDGHRCAEDLRAVCAESAALAAPLELAVTVSDEAEGELAFLGKLLSLHKPSVCRWLIFHRREKSTRGRWVQMARRALGDFSRQVLLGAGTNANFAELNRERPPLADCDLICYPVNPQVHATDNATLAENMAGLASTVESGRKFTGALPLAVTPVTLRPRFNPDGTAPAPPPEPGQLPSNVDPRQMSLFGAGWTLGCLKHFFEAGPESLTLYETVGWRGIMESEEGSPLPEVFRSIPGTVFPLYHVFADLAEFGPASAICTQSSRPLDVEGLALARGGRTRILLANLTSREQQVRVVTNRPFGDLTARILDETNVETSVERPEQFRSQPGFRLSGEKSEAVIDLLPFAIVRLDMN